MLRGIDHIVILVRDLAQASRDYADAGFTVTPGGEHAGGATHNALVCFGDGAYFELIAFKEPATPQPHRWWTRLAQGEGLVDYALLSDDLAAEAERLRAAGLAGEVQDGGRTRPDGQRLVWRSVMLGPGSGLSPLPFVIQDVTPRELRVPGGDATRQSLPVTRVAGLSLVVADLGEGRRLLTTLLGVEGQPSTPSAAGTAGAARFQVGRQWLELLQPSGDTGAPGAFLRDRGQGPFEVVLSGDGDAAPGAGDLLPLDATHGARIRVAR